MDQPLFTLEELTAKVRVHESEIAAWTEAKLLKPAGFTDENATFYTAVDVDRALHIQKLRDLGYGLDDIQKILKKVGLPKTAEAFKKDKSAGKFLTVGQLAERTGLSPRTIKHWEDIGIIEPEMRSEGGFRLYGDIYVYLCQLIRDLQLFGYTLEEIKAVSGYFRDFLTLQKDLSAAPREEAARKLEAMLGAVEEMTAKMNLLKSGTARWEDLLKKKKKEIVALRTKNEKRATPAKGQAHA
jgi:DNA-binding transcriptional MerR regulator